MGESEGHPVAVSQGRAEDSGHRLVAMGREVYELER